MYFVQSMSVIGQKLTFKSKEWLTESYTNCALIVRIFWGIPQIPFPKWIHRIPDLQIQLLFLKCLMMLDVFLWLIHPEDQVIKTFIDFDCFYRLKLSVGIPFIVWSSVSGGLKTCSTLEMQKIERPPRFYLKSGYKYSSKIQSGSKRFEIHRESKRSENKSGSKRFDSQLGSKR